MRTTINLDDDVFGQVKQYAETRSVALGRAVSDLLRRGLATPLPTQIKNGIHVVVLPPGSSAVDSNRVKKLLEDE